MSHDVQLSPTASNSHPATLPSPARLGTSLRLSSQLPPSLSRRDAVPPLPHSAMTPPNAAGTPKSPATHASSPASRPTCNDSPEPPKQDTTPDSAPESRLIEIFFSVIQKKVVSPNDFASLEQLSGTLLAFTGRYNQTAKPRAPARSVI